MIYVDRGGVPVPPSLLTTAAQERRDAEAFYAEPEEKRRQQSFSFVGYRAPDVRQAVTELFLRKCAFCESPVGVASDGDVEHLRPISGVVTDDGSFLPDHYWWLALDWRNLYLICTVCNRSMKTGAGVGTVGKGSRFPLLAEPTRAPVLAPWNELDAEMKVLLDPCADEPEKHLVFLADGSVVSSDPRGQGTIDLLTLNRPALIEARREEAAVDERMFGLVRELSYDRSTASGRDQLEQAFAPLMERTQADVPYAGMHRQLVGAFRAEIFGDLTSTGDDVYLPEDVRQKAKTEHRRHVVRQSEFSLADADHDAVFRSVSRLIERIRIRNVKAIGELDLDLTRSTSATAPWTTLLGENGTGKSTLLKAVAVALIGPAYVERLKLDPGSFVRRAPNVRSGSIEVHLANSAKPRRVVFREDRFEYQGAVPPQTLVFGYGETRLLPQRGVRSAKGERWGRVDNLFAPTVGLADAERWLQKVDQATFDYTAGAMQNLFRTPGGKAWLRLERTDEAVVVHEWGRTVPLQALSAGYQSMLGMIIDILEVTFRFWPTPGSAEGVVLLDEIDAHIHPRWKMRIVGELRSILPGMQFITTTHEPLCLRGLGADEVVVLTRDERDRISAATDLPSPAGLRVDQLLTSRHFGLSSTLDPEIEAAFDEYYQLLSRQDDTLTDEQRARRNELAAQLQGQGVLGHTRRDQLIYEAVDTYLANQRPGATPSPEPDAARLATLTRVAQLWDLYTAGGGTPG